MPGQGMAPKDPSQRRNRTPPARGEWVDLPPLTESILPSLPKRAKGTGRWSARTQAAWRAWSADPVTSQYGPADIQAAIDLIFLYETWVRGADAAAEIRQRQDRLGLNPKGKRDLRWRMAAAPAEPEKPRRQPSRSSKRRAKLSIVA